MLYKLNEKKRGWSDWIRDESSRTNETFICKDLVTTTAESLDGKEFVNYGHYVFEWIRQWTKETREKIILDGIITDKSMDFLFYFGIYFNTC